MRLPGLFLVIALLLIPGYWFYGLTSQYDFTPLLSQYLGVAAIVAMGFVQLMATRLTGLEVLFGGLDRIYILHKWLGITALAMVILHNTIDSEIDGLISGSLADFAESLGGFSLDVLQILVLVTVITAIPYKLWRWSHKFIGVLYICGVLHFIFIPKPFELLSAVGIYTLVFGVVGILSYFYCLFPRVFKRRHYSYEITAVEQFGQASAITLAPVGKALKHQPGQFAFVSFEHNNLTEVHPFTISKAPDAEGNLRFTISALGDYTSRLQNLVSSQAEIIGTKATITGPHGHFQLKYTKTPQVWIGAGIGITPFLAWAQNVSDDQAAHLFYCFKQSDSAAHLDELKQLITNKPNLTLHCVDSSLGERLTAQKLANELSASWPKVSVSFCGPKAMRQSLIKECKALGLSSRRFHFEEFEIRSGVGLMKLIRWISGHIQTRFPELYTAFKKYWDKVMNGVESRLPS